MVCPFDLLSFSHCIVCPSPIYGSWFPLWYLQIVLQYILHINLRGKDRYHAYVISDNCCRPYSYRHVETQWGLVRNETLRQNLSSFITHQRICNKSSAKGATCGVETIYPFGSYVFTPVWWRGLWCSFFGSLSHLLDIALSFILLLLYRQTCPTRIFLLLDVELSNLCSLGNFDLHMFYIEFILE